MATRITVTKAELAALRKVWELLAPDPGSPDRDAAKFAVALHSLLAKAALAHEPLTAKEAGPVLGELETAFLTAARSKGCRMGHLGPRDAAALVGRAAQLRITSEEMAQVGTWLFGQGWIKRGVTLSQVLRNWPEWSGRAKGERPVLRTAAPAPLLEDDGEVPATLGGAQ